jgi:ABC-type multidrug transport system ATPase subunit
VDLDPSWNQETQRLLIPAAKCIIEIGNVPIPIGLSCAFGDCYDDGSLTAVEVSNQTLLDPPGILQRSGSDSENVVGSGSMRSPPETGGDMSDPGKTIMTDSESLSSLGGSSEGDGTLSTSTASGSSDEDQICKAEKAVGITHVMVNQETNQCTCKEGWMGPECNVCTTDQQCGGEGSVCLKSPAIVEAISNKTYSCELEDNSPLLPFLGVGNFWGQCSLDKKTCTVNFGGANTTQPHVTCLGKECAFGSAAASSSDGGGGTTNIGDIKTDIECSSTSCAPSEEFGWPSTLPTFIRDPLGSQTTSIKISCTGSDSAVCTVNVALIPLPIDINCTFGDCYGSVGESGASGDSSSSSLALVEDPEISSEESTAPQYNPLPKEMIFLPVVIFAVLALAGVTLVYIESKKSYLRSLFAKEMKALTGGQKVKGLAVSDMSPALNSPEAYYPEYARSDKFADIHMNIMSELSFTGIYYDVAANPEDEAWMEEGNSISIRESVSQIRLKVRQSVRNIGSILHTRKSQELPSLDTPDSKHIEFVSTTFKNSGRSLEEHNSMPEIAFEGDGSPESDDDLDLEKIYTPQSDKTPGSRSPSVANNSEHILDKVRNGPTHRRDSSTSTGAGLMSGFGNTIQRTASRVRETFKSQFTKKKKRILHGVTGSIYRGNMLAIMGPSGCGKSTLLNILADENLFGAKVRGNVYIDGKKRQKWYRHITVYIPQSDELIPILTVKESVLYSGLLRLPWYYSRGRRVHKVYDVLDQLKIDHVAESQVGGSCDIRGISGGERRRVSIGMGLVADPKIMILDEPTSGLDSAAASSIVTTLKDLAGKGDGRIVIASLHQPSFETFRELDLLLLLAKGRQIYFGEASGVKQHFDKCGFPCPKGLNIADYILHVVVDLNCLRELLNSQKAFDSLRESEVSDRDATPLSDSKQSTMNPTRKKSLENLWQVEMYKPMTSELGVLIKRSFKQIWRRPLLLRLQIILAIVAALLSIAMFSNMQRDIAGVQNRLGFFFFQLAFFGFAGISSIDLILEERSVFIREIQGKFYTPLAYYLSKVIVDGIMLRILPMLIYDLLVYWSIGLREGAAHFALYLISTLLFSLATGALSIAVTMGSKTGGVASLGIILLLLFSILFGGFLSNRGAIPDWIGWIQYLSIYYQVMGVLVSNEMRGTTFSTTISKGIEIEISADQVLDKIEFAVEPNLTSYVGALAALYFAWIFIGYVLMKIYLSDGRDWKRMWKKLKQC